MRFILNILQVAFIWVWTLVTLILGFLTLPLVGQKKSIYITSQFWCWPILFISGVKVKVEGKQNIPQKGHFIYTSNHESSYDIPLIFAALPVPIFYLAKEELKKIPFFGWYIEAVGMIFVNRGNHKKAMESIIKAGNEIKKGKNIITFAEGTRPRDGKMKLFKRGSFILALENQINVIPIAIIGSKEVNPPGYKISSGTVIIRIGEMVDVSNFEKSNPDVLAKFVEDKVREMRSLGGMKS
tara:strand:+ start:15170 stop:15889 length:720 start_codon:yes stop_codon:yes gene_type:complete